MDRLPDLSDMPTIDPDQLKFFKKYKRKNYRERRLPHKDMPGLCGQDYNSSLDFAMEMNLWAVQFLNALGKSFDLVPRFVLGQWLKYCSLMKGQPLLTTKKAQLVLKYLLVNKSTVVKNWRNRLLS